MEEKEYVFTQQKKEYEQLPKGNYECVIDHYDYKQTSSNKTFVSISIKIREDVPSNAEKYRKWHIFETLWLNENGELTNFYTLQSLVNTQPREENEIKLTMQQALDLLNGAKLKVGIDYKADQNLETKQVRKYYTSDYQEKVVEQGTVIDLNSDDLDDGLPF